MLAIIISFQTTSLIEPQMKTINRADTHTPNIPL